MTIKVRFDGRVLVPEQPVDFPIGIELEIVVTSPAPPTSQLPGKRSTLARLADIAGQFPENPDLPADLAAQHDHYLHGTPKRP